MALNCSLLGSALALDCSNPPLGGLESFVYLFNLEDKVSAPIVGSGDNTVSTITLAATKLAYKWQGGTDFILGTYDLRTGRVLNGFGHTVQLTVPEDDQDALTEIKNLANGRVVAVVVKRGFAENTFRIYGLQHGLEVSEVAGDESNTDNAGLPLITLATPDGYKEPLPPQHMLDTDYATTLAILEGLLT